jgi:Tfp pilus assembly protein PilX
MKKRPKLKDDEQGLIAIVVTVFFIMILSLIVLAFSQSTRREQRQTLDRQLVSQAYYAAESGVNDAIEWVRTHPGQNVDKCTGAGSWLALNPGFNQNLDTGAQASFSYSCLLINQSPTSLVFGDVDVNDGQTVSLGTTAGQQLKSVTFTWKEAVPGGIAGSTFSGCTPNANILKFEAATSYSTDCDAGMLRIYLMPISAAATRDSIAALEFNTFLRPINGVPPTNAVNYAAYASSTQGQVVAGDCSAGICTATINNIIAAGRVYLHMRSIYKDNQVTITGTTAAGTPANFNDAQAVIDATGKAADVLRRVQVRAPISPTFIRSPYTISSMNGICKQLNVFPGSATGVSPPPQSLTC